MSQDTKPDHISQKGLVYRIPRMDAVTVRRDVTYRATDASQDQMPHLNETIDRFVSRALTRNLPITFTNHPAAPHAFDLFHDSETSRELIR